MASSPARASSGSSMWRWLLFFITFLILIIDAVSVCVKEDAFSSDRARLLTITAAVLYATLPTEFGFHEGGRNAYQHNIRGYRHRKRCRKNIKDIFLELGAYYVRRACRMPEQDFWELLSLIEHDLVNKKKSKKNMYNHISTRSDVKVGDRFVLWHIGNEPETSIREVTQVGFGSNDVGGSPTGKDNMHSLLF